MKTRIEEIEDMIGGNEDLAGRYRKVIWQYMGPDAVRGFNRMLEKRVSLEIEKDRLERVL